MDTNTLRRIAKNYAELRVLNETFSQTFVALSQRIDDTLNEIYDTLCNMCKANGGYVKTPASDDKPTLYAYYEDWSSETRFQKAIHGIRYDDELGLCICTDDMLENYQFDNKYYFYTFRNFEGEDLENLEKVLADSAYYVGFDNYDLIRQDTLISIVGGISHYLE